jgi:ATP-dependent Lhr-like helicase
VTAFDLLHPAVQHHVVNSLGWKGLRPLQEAAVEPIIAGSHALLLAPTAGGKTEAAILPVFSRMLSEDWRGLSVVYVCPIKALLNNLEERLIRYAGLLGRRVSVWHGDIPPGQRARTARESPDLLLATPESLEVVLVSRRVDHRTFFKDLRVFIIDEIHAFAGDDRGWHLIGLLDRLSRLSGRVPQRLGLSATVGNPGALLEWLVGGNLGERRVVASEAGVGGDAEVQIDFVGSLENAATVISRLHRGEKRLVFCDSRSQVESLAVALRARSVQTYVSHSSLSVDARRQAESAFASGDDCVIVATSTLELGIDVGDLDRVIQIDAPHTVASFLQRLGRTGRRAGTRRNCLFLATTDDALLRAVALVQLWREGFVEPIIPPALPYHVLAQQLLALALQESGIGTRTWQEWLPGFLAGSGIATEEISVLVQYMLATGVLFAADGLLGVGLEGEARYGLKNFLELFSVFSSAPLFTVLHGRSEIGQVHQLTFQARDRTQVTLALGGRQWMVKHVDWDRRRAFVEPTDVRGRSRWLGAGQPMHFRLCQAVKLALVDDTQPTWLSKRGAQALADLRLEYDWVDPERTSVTQGDKVTDWWTFGGLLLNGALAERLRERGYAPPSYDDLRVRFSGRIEISDLLALPRDPAADAGRLYSADVARRSTDAMKFIECVPAPLRDRLEAERFSVRDAFKVIGAQPILIASGR